MRLLGVTVLLAAMAHAQTYEIRGSVTEPGVGGIAGAQTLEIVIDDKAAQLSGTVNYGIASPKQVAVVLQRVIGDFSLSLLSLIERVTGNGQFKFLSLRPGDYRILAVPLDDLPLRQAPEALQRVLAGAEKITIEPGVSQTVTVRFTTVVR